VKVVVIEYLYTVSNESYLLARFLESITLSSSILQRLASVLYSKVGLIL